MRIEKNTTMLPDINNDNQEVPDNDATEKVIDYKVPYRILQLGCILAMGAMPITGSMLVVFPIAAITTATVYLSFKIHRD